MSGVRAVLAFPAALFGLVLTLPLVLLALPFWVVSLATRGLSGLLQPGGVALGQVIQFDLELGWRAKPNVRAHVLDENRDAYLVTTDDSGWRGRASLDDADVVVIGDSFAFGCAIDDDDFFADLSRDVRVKAIGAPGYSIVQLLLLSRHLAPRLAGKVVVWMVYPGNDLADTLRPEMDGYRTPFLRSANGRGGWEIVDAHVNSDRWPFPARTHSHESLVEICTPSFLSRRVFAACGHLVELGRDVCRDAGARLVVMTVPEMSPLSRRRMAQALARVSESAAFDPDLPDLEIAAICSRLGVPFVALNDHLSVEDYRENDIHWNRRGHEVVSEVLRRVYHEHCVESGVAAARPAEVPPPCATPQAP